MPKFIISHKWGAELKGFFTFTDTEFFFFSGLAWAWNKIMCNEEVSAESYVLVYPYFNHAIISKLPILKKKQTKKLQLAYKLFKVVLSKGENWKEG